MLGTTNLTVCYLFSLCIHISPLGIARNLTMSYSYPFLCYAFMRMNYYSVKLEVYVHCTAIHLLLTRGRNLL